MISSRALGLLFLFITSAAWIGASFITQALVAPTGDQEQASLEPWLLTLICSSTLMIYLPIGHFARKRARYEGRGARAARSHRQKNRQRKGPTVGTIGEVALETTTGSMHTRRRAAVAAAAPADGGGVEGDDDSDEDGVDSSDAEVGALGRSSAARSGRERLPLLHPHTHKLQQHSSDVGAAQSVSGGVGGDADSVDGSSGGNDSGTDVETAQIIRAALVVAPVWFAAQLAFTASLEYTSVTSNTVLSSCSSLFVYLGSLALGQEMSSALRFTSVVAAMAGTSLVALGDTPASKGGAGGGSTNGSGSNPLVGDALTLAAAALYALYTIMMKRLLVKDDAAAMALFFGTIGLLYFAVLAPVASVLALAGASVVRRVTSQALGLALIQGLVDYVAADYAWARAVMLLGPTATSCGLAMQIPAAGIIDGLVNGNRLSWSESPASLAQFVVGSLLIVCGFVGVSLEPRVVISWWKRCTDCGGNRSASGGGSGGSMGGGVESGEWGPNRPTWSGGEGAAADAAPEGTGVSGSDSEHRRGSGAAGGGRAARSSGGAVGPAGGGQGRSILRAVGISSGGGPGVGDMSYIPLSHTPPPPVPAGSQAPAGSRGLTAGTQDD